MNRAATMSARRAALLGLTVPLSPIMVAVLGLWPELEEEAPPASQVYGGGGRRWRDRAPRWLRPAMAGAVPGVRTQLKREDDDALAEKVRRNWEEIEQIREVQAQAEEQAAALERERIRRDNEDRAIILALELLA